MDGGSAIQLLVIVILLGLSAFFSSAETALMACNKIRMKNLAEDGNKMAAKVLQVTENQPKMLSAILIGNNLVNLSASALATVFATNTFGSGAVGLSTGILTLLVLLFGEITPKTLASIHQERLALAYAKPIRALMLVMTPVIFLMNHISGAVLMLLRSDSKPKGNTITEMELRTLVNVGHEEGVIKTEERQMIYNVFDFDDSRAEDIMVPRIDVTFADINSSYEDLVQLFREEKHTRFPVYRDSTDNIVGIANIKDLLLCDKENFSLEKILREPYFTYEYKKTSELLMDMKENSVSFAIVLDEYGATSGIVTLENLVEEIVGDIHDEYEDQEEEEIREILPEREYIALGSTRLDDLDEVLHLDIESQDYDSIGGYIIEQLDRFPEKGESVTTESGIRLVVDQVDRTRIEQVHIYLPPKKEIDEEKEATN